MFCIYQHIRLDTNTVFYVGKGLSSKGLSGRAFSKHGCNQYWKNIVNSVGYRVEIVESELVDETVAYTKEMSLIKHYKDLGQCEANLTNGSIKGGPAGIKRVFTKEHKEKLSLAHKGQSRPNPYKGIKTGRLAWNKGLKSPYKAKQVIDLSTGFIWDSIKEAAEVYCINYSTLRARLTGQNINNTDLRLI